MAGLPLAPTSQEGGPEAAPRGDAPSPPHCHVPPDGTLVAEGTREAGQTLAGAADVVARSTAVHTGGAGLGAAVAVEPWGADCGEGVVLSSPAAGTSTASPLGPALWSAGVTEPGPSGLGRRGSALLLWHEGPRKPGAHSQRPSAGAQDPPFSQLQVAEQLRPQWPGGHMLSQRMPVGRARGGST